MSERASLGEAVKGRGPYVVWDLLSEQEQHDAAAALWTNADRPSRAAIEQALAKELKFRPQSVRRLPVERVAGRLSRLAENLPEPALFQFLLHLHLADRRTLLVELLDSLELPHKDGVLDLADDATPPAADKLEVAARKLIEAHGRQALVYLATLKVADSDFWTGLDPVLAEYGDDGEKL